MQLCGKLTTQMETGPTASSSVNLSHHLLFTEVIFHCYRVLGTGTQTGGVGFGLQQNEEETPNEHSFPERIGKRETILDVDDCDSVQGHQYIGAVSANARLLSY